MNGPAWAKTRRLLLRRESFTFLDQAHRRWTELGLGCEVLSALLDLEGLNRQPGRLSATTPGSTATWAWALARTVQSCVSSELNGCAVEICRDFRDFAAVCSRWSWQATTKSMHAAFASVAGRLDPDRSAGVGFSEKPRKVLRYLNTRRRPSVNHSFEARGARGQSARGVPAGWT